MTISEIAEEVGQSYNHVSRVLSHLYWKKPYPMTRCLLGKKVKYRWSTSG